MWVVLVAPGKVLSRWLESEELFLFCKKAGYVDFILNVATESLLPPRSLPGYQSPPFSLSSLCYSLGPCPCLSGRLILVCVCVPVCWGLVVECLSPLLPVMEHIHIEGECLLIGDGGKGLPGGDESLRASSLMDLAARIVSRQAPENIGTRSQYFLAFRIPKMPATSKKALGGRKGVAVSMGGWPFRSVSRADGHVLGG